MKKKLRYFILGLFIVFAACVTVNIYFPAAAIQKAADEIVEDVRGLNDNESILKIENDKRSGTIGGFICIIGPKEVHAQINAEVSTPAIRNLKQAMRSNFPQLRLFYDKGAIGENNQGFIEVRDAGGLNLKERADLTRLIDQENNNRRALYTEIMNANKLGVDSLPKIQQIFAKSWRDKSQPGWWVQNDQGAWQRR